MSDSNDKEPPIDTLEVQTPERSTSEASDSKGQPPRLRLVEEGVSVDEHIDDAVLLDFGAHRLDAAQAEPVVAHLAVCADCRALLYAQRIPPPAGLEDFVHKQMFSHAQRRRRLRRRLPPIGLAAAVLLGVAIYYLLRSPADDLPNPPSDSLLHYALGELQGCTQKTMGPASTLELCRLLPYNRVKLILQPERELSGSPPKLAVLAARDGEPLRRLAKAEIVSTKGGGFIMTGGAHDLFGEEAGHWTLFMVLSTRGDFSAWEGRSADVARRRRPDEAWHEASLIYEVQD